MTHPAVATMSDADFRRAARLSASRHGFDWQAYRDHFEWHVEATGSHPRSAAAVVAEMVRDTVAFHNEEQIGQVRDRASLERLRDWATATAARHRRGLRARRRRPHPRERGLSGPRRRWPRGGDGCRQTATAPHECGAVEWRRIGDSNP